MRSRKIILSALVLTSLFLPCGCSLPRIIILNDPLSAEEHHALCTIYESQHKYDLAREQCRAALRKNPKFTPSLLLLGELSYRLKDYSEAEAAYDRALELQPENGDIYNNLCWVYIERKTGLRKAEVLIRKAITLNPAHKPNYLDTLGVVLLRLGKTGESIAALSESVDTLPGEGLEFLAEAYGHLAEAYKEMGNEEKAREAEESKNNLLSGVSMRR